MDERRFDYFNYSEVENIFEKNGVVSWEYHGVKYAAPARDVRVIEVEDEGLLD